MLTRNDNIYTSVDRKSILYYIHALCLYSVIIHMIHALIYLSYNSEYTYMAIAILPIILYDYIITLWTEIAPRSQRRCC